MGAIVNEYGACVVSTMSSQDKRRRARVQGGWAAPSRPGSKTNRPAPPTAATCNAAPAWLGKTVDCPEKPQKFVYQEPTEEIRLKVEPTTIEKPGIYDISLEPSGVSRLRFFPNFIGPKECEQIYSNLFTELQWRQREESKHGETWLQPRLTAWFGDAEYTYGSITHKADTNWNSTLASLRSRLEENTGYNFNSVLCNLYRDGHDSVDWHADDEPSLGNNPVIASLSFGDSRLFELKKKFPKDSPEAEYAPLYRVYLNAGSLLIMEGSTQEDWLHRIPKEYHDRGPRINLTYRVIHG